MKKDNKEFVEETIEEKNERWNKQNKTARAFAKLCGINLKSVSKERNKIAAEKIKSKRTY